MSGDGITLLVDGYNLLLALAERDRVRDVAPRLPELRERLHDLLEAWTEAEPRAVICVWDGAAPRHPGSYETLRVVYVEPPAEADDWIVAEAASREAQGLKTAVFTRDSGLRRRLPKRCQIVPFDRLVDAFEALAASPLSAPHVTGPSEHRLGVDELLAEIGASREIDTGRLPRRRSGADPSAAESPRRAPGREGGTSPGASAEQEPRAAARARRDARRRRWQRANARRRRAKDR